jgi:uncharacterized membrane protein
MMRPFLVGGLLLALASAAQAQGLYGDPGRLNALQMQVDQAQRDALSSQQAADAAQMRFQTEQRIASLNAERTARSAAVTPPLSPMLDDGLLQSAMERARALDVQVGADSDRLSQLTDQALARSNARIVAVKPALR